MDALLQSTLILQLGDNLGVAVHALGHERRNSLQSLRVIAKELPKHIGSLHAIKFVQLLQLRQHFLNSGEFSTTVGKVHFELEPSTIDQRVCLLDACLIQAALEGLAQSDACRLSGYAGLIHHDEQRRQHLAGFQPVFADDLEGR
ncbi:hypothetical protein D3C71_1220510 [compost metagenome]